MTSRNYCFTINNPEGPLDTSHELIGYCIYQLEKGEAGTPHYQGYVELNKSVRHAALRKLGGLWAKAHYEARQGTQQQARSYCQKEEGRLAEPVESGVLAVAGKKRSAETDLQELKSRLLTGVEPDTIFLEDPMVERNYGRTVERLYEIVKRTQKRNWKPHVVVLYGPSGKGKSRSVWDVEQHLYPRPLNDSQWWENYTGQEAILMDDYRCSDSFNELLRILDRHPMSVPRRNCKGGQPFLAKRIYITTTIHPKNWYKNVLEETKEQLMRRLTVILDVHDLTYPQILLELKNIKSVPNEINTYDWQNV